ncbi:GNAT family N-acetyltransferase [Streptomyces sp. NPDC007095]|uniref:GNAT family N-acetyltransferase n=1 Tax=Streptomyces sp. NPDC007095 TaxID=3154482 RepID=UPI00340D9D2A
MSTVARPTPPQSPAAPHILDNAAWAALTGPHAHLAERVGRAARYALDVSPFTALAGPVGPRVWDDLAALAGPVGPRVWDDLAALADPAGPRAWDDLAALVGPGTVTHVTGARSVPEGWETVQHGQGVQLVDTSLRAEPAPEAVRLGLDDVPEILDLIALTEPGPFLPRTVELGTYLGIRHRGRLVALAGERSEMGVPPAGGWGRLRPPGWTEISAVCTAPDHRGKGLATRLVRAMAAGIRQRGDTPFLHASATNTGAIRLYESIGFTLRRRSQFLLVRTPGAQQEQTA